MRGCLNEEILQRYLDGELSGERMESVAAHLAACVTCAAAFRDFENENHLVRSALAAEFDTAVPTERLQRRIDAAIAGLRVVNPARSRASSGWLQSLSGLFNLTPQRSFGYVGLFVLLALVAVLAVIRWGGDRSSPIDSQAKNNPIGSGTMSSNPTVAVLPPKTVDKGVVSTQAHRRTTLKKNWLASPSVNRNEQAEIKLLPGERSYLKTIAQLDTTIKKTGNTTMRPALQAEYERNLALVDRAIAATRSAAKSNPNDPDAAEFMFAAYQSKVDLLNTIADARVYNRQR